MNKQRRKQLSDITEKIEELQCDISALADEEEEAYDNLPESLQDGERGEKMQEAIDNMRYAYDNLQEAYDNIMEAMQ